MQLVTVYQFLIVVTNDYQIQCEAILEHFKTVIKQIVKDSLNSYFLQERSQKNLIAILNKCVEKVNDELAVKRYHIKVNKQALKSPFNPDFESEQYYEHLSCLEINESYTKITRYNVKIWKNVIRRHRQKNKVKWVFLFKTVRELISIEPLKHFWINLCQAFSSQFTLCWSIFNY